MKKIIFEAQDYQQLNKIKCLSDIDKALAQELLVLLLKKANANADRLIVNASKETKSFGDEYKEIYNPYYQRGRLNGVVGTVSGTIEYEGQHYFVVLHIVSRMDTLDKPYFLTRLLLLDTLNVNSSAVPNGEKELLDYLYIGKFINQLSLVIKKGIYKTYHQFYGNDSKVRGNIDISNHIKTNIGQDCGRIFYQYKQRTANNSFNKLLVGTYKYLKYKYPQIMRESFDVKSDLKSLILMLESIVDSTSCSPRKLIMENEKKITHPYYRVYEELRKTCISILKEDKAGLWGLSDNEVGGILYYMPDLWERYIEYFFCKFIRNRKLTNVSIDSQVNNKMLFSNGKYIIDTRPDFVLSAEDKKIMILDAKFKPGWKAVFKGSSFRGLNEDVTKCLRDMVVINGNHTGTIFPIKLKSGEECAYLNDQIVHRISEYNANVKFYTFPIYIPGKVDVNDGDDYTKWCTCFDEKTNAAFEIIIKYVELIAAENEVLK